MFVKRTVCRVRSATNLKKIFHFTNSLNAIFMHYDNLRSPFRGFLKTNISPQHASEMQAAKSVQPARILPRISGFYVFSPMREGILFFC